jgi:mono/diheme cytochrome c family protein
MREAAFLSLALLLVTFSALPASAAERILTLSFAGETQRFTAAELLARPDAASITIPADISYRRAMTYHAVPLLALIGEAALKDADTIAAKASDGFVSQIPASLVQKAASGGSVPWVAIEDPAAPWPNLPGKDESGGPFYLVWKDPERSNVGSEQWPYALAELAAVESPLRRWPQLAVDPALPDTAAERVGQASFIKNCMPCHRLKGAGSGDVGPDLGQPMNVTAYMKPSGIRAIVRDPKSVRTWPGQIMIGFTEAQISDAELDALIAYLVHMAQR